MIAPLNDHLLQVADLVDRPGSSREVDLRLPVPEDFDLPLADVAAPVRLTGVIESVVEGLLVRGTLTAGIGLLCSRCLQEVHLEPTVDVVELFADPDAVDPDVELEEGYELRDGHLSVASLLRDALAAAIPYQPRCSASCRGLCAQCGANLNETECTCADEVIDPRWAALEGLRLPE